ncbi:MAG: NDP-sugar synthase [Syntrophales bacterium]|nr:NDP-sugar synthase [Syntrophales bacterium]
MKVAILAAGLGTRLRPLTDLVPKTLMPVLNRPLIGVLLAQVEEAGFLQVAVNTHHLAEQVQQFLVSRPWSFNLSISPEPELLGTGGGLRQLGEILRAEAFLAINGDILTGLDLGAIRRSHRQEAATTLVLHDCPPFNNVWVDGAGKLAGVGERPAAAQGPPLAYTGVQVVGRKILEYIPPGGPYDLVAAWRQALEAGETIDTTVMAGHFWQDLGTPEAYLTAHQRLLQGEAPELARYFGPLADPLIGPGSYIEPGVKFGGGVSLGAMVRIGAGAYLRRTVVWDGAAIDPGVELQDCIVASGVRVGASARGQVLA